MRRSRRWASGVGVFLLAVAASAALYRLSVKSTSSDCPIFARLLPISRAPIRGNDFLEVEMLPGYSYWIPYRLRVYGDGRVDRQTVFPTSSEDYRECPLHEADKHASISAQTAVSLIAEARDGGFCRLCRYYNSAADFVSDAGSTSITVSVGKRPVTVSNSAGMPPALFYKIEESVGQLLPMQSFADWSKFSPERTAECKAFELQRESSASAPK